MADLTADFPHILTADNPFVPLNPSTEYQGSGTNSQIRSQYYIYCDENGNVDDSGLKSLPQTRLMPCTGIAVEKTTNVDIRPTGAANCCIAEVVWSVPNLGNASELKVPGNLLSVNFSSQGREIRVANAFETLCYQSENGAVAETSFPNGLPVINEDCRNIGCPVTTATKKYSETFCISRDTVDKAFCRQIDVAVGTLNQQVYRDCNPREMKLTGVVGNRNSLQSDWTFQFSFEIRQPVFSTNRFFIGFSDPDNPCQSNAIEEDFILMIEGFNHVVPWTHDYTCSETGGKQVTLDRLYIHRPNRTSNFLAQLGV